MLDLDRIPDDELRAAIAKNTRLLEFDQSLESMNRVAINTKKLKKDLRAAMKLVEPQHTRQQEL